ncbi:uncharacterized protein LOC126966876 [Leptidea sinapis]|uniref:Uncharacterized protein n=1 Tax=Leptidea sinapis TaxID=189913 RepID=A0A5E4PNN6_9NEOP|nr:uncharacterized protein LOC126966876 [Leptidea sinapis]VVC87443.1 unnamed protein product [Leptidea sinapis]
MWHAFIFLEVFVVLYIAEIESITVKPCPTNKIAPHRRMTRYDRAQTRTFGHFYSLFVDEQDAGPGGLQEQPQADEPDDCGDIEDYDENDLSSLTTNQQKKRAHDKNRFFFGQFFNILQNEIPTKPSTVRPGKPTYRPTRPPPGGYFGTNSYRPPLPHDPTDQLKPVHENGIEPEMVYRPGLVGVPLGHVIGAQQIKPTRFLGTTPQNKYIHSSTQHPKVHRQPRTRNTYEDGVVRSFLDLLF